MSAEVSPIGRGPNQAAMASAAANGLVAKIIRAKAEHAALVELARQIETARAELEERHGLQVSWGRTTRELGAVLEHIRAVPFWDREPVA